jgi:hypothetical protein
MCARRRATAALLWEKQIVQQKAGAARQTVLRKHLHIIMLYVC